MTKQNINVIWEKIVKNLSGELPHSAYESWIKPIKPVSADEEVFTIATNSDLSRDWVIKNYSASMVKHLKTLSPTLSKIKVIVDKNIKKDETKSSIEQIEPPKSATSLPQGEFQINAFKSTSSNLNLKYTFETFVVGSHNKFAHASALAVAKEPAKNYNPLFIYGGTGLGKTHLMQAIGHYILVNHPELKVKYTNTETFTNDLVNSLKRGGNNNEMSNFRQKYRYVDVLLLDDIQFIESKTQTQEEIFHTFEYLHGAGKQIIITSDRPPQQISTLTDRLRSRFEWGLLADIQPPDIETRIAILQNKAEMDNMEVPQDIIELIAMAYSHNIRELEGALNRVVAYASINECPLNIDTVRKVINFKGQIKNLTIDRIIEETAKYFSIEPSEIKGLSRSKDMSAARQIAVYITREMIGASFPVIGEAFGGRKHTSILYAYEKVKEEIQTDRGISESVRQISQEISANYTNKCNNYSI